MKKRKLTLRMRLKREKPKSRTKRIPPPVVEVAPPRRERITTNFLGVLKGWESLKMHYSHSDGIWHDYEYMMSPKKNVYRRAYPWEKPTLVIDAGILPPEHHIRLVRITDKALCIKVTTALKLRRRHDRT